MDWQSAAKRLSEAVGDDWLPEEVREAFAASSQPLFVACSGGADSLFVLLTLWAWRHDGRLRQRPLRVLHFDHALRGEESAADANFVERVSAGLGLSCEAGRADWQGEADRATEQTAREARLTFFERSCAGVSEPPFDVVTGHHANDVVETMLLRLSRGSGLQGLTAPRPVSWASSTLRFLRPALGWERVRLRSALEGCGIAWREDATNAQSRHHRNRLRQAVIPAWQAASDRPLWQGVGRSRRLLQEDWEALERWVDQRWEELSVASGKEGMSLPLDALRSQPVAVQRRLLQRLGLMATGKALEAAAEDALVEAVKQPRTARYDLSQRYRVVVELESVRVVDASRNVAPGPFSFRLPVGTCAYLANGAVIACEAVRVEGELADFLASGACDDSRRVYVTRPQKHCSAVCVRQRQAGDAFKPKGKSSPKKLKNLLIERKINVGERDHLPVVTDELGQIIWVPGLPPASERLLAAGDALALRLTYQK